MKTQISRNAHQPEKGYSGVYQQMGRMITDADWNALTDIEKQKLAAALADVIASGAPRVGGLAINLDGTVQPGDLYVDGLRARLTGSAPLTVTAQPDYPDPPSFSGKNVRLYADVWERTVTALEDSTLLDAALHGADTTTRSQRMLQVKWCNVSKNPENPAHNPPVGSGKLTLKLRKIFVGDDHCDPCASEVDLDERVGNYLFRVEVHDVYLEGDKNFLVLKWSRDNGAEAYAVDKYPVGFNQGDWVWEFFDTDSEKTLGHHFPGNFKPRRGGLKTEFAVPGGGDPHEFVRQWDGYAVVNLSDNTLESGYDRGTDLSEAVSGDAHGFVGFDSGGLTINGERLELVLAYQGEAFVAGDYWQAAVREAVDASGGYVLGSAGGGDPPQDILHHYLELGQLDSAGNLVSMTDAKRRQFHFPPLTDISAADVGFTDNCPGLYHGAENVQAALDELCSIGAEDIAYVPPECTASVRENLVSALAGWADLDSDGKVSVKDMLDALLCELNSATLPYEVPDCGSDSVPTVRSLLGLSAGNRTAADALNALLCHLDTTALPHQVPDCGDASAPSVRSLLGLPAGPTPTAEVLDALLCALDANRLPLDKSARLCPALDDPEITTVQQALKVLCSREGGGCAISVEAGDDLQKLLEAFANEPDALDIWLCLKPGDHTLPADLRVMGKRSIKITGAGRVACTVSFQGSIWQLQAREIHLEDIGIQFHDGSGGLILQGNNISAAHNQFLRASRQANNVPMVDVSLFSAHARKQGGYIHWMDNLMTATWQRGIVGVDEIAPSNVLGAEINAKFKDLLSTETRMLDSASYEAALADLASNIGDLPTGVKENWRVAVDGNVSGMDFSRDSSTLRSEFMLADTTAFFAGGSAGRNLTFSSTDAIRAVGDIAVADNNVGVVDDLAILIDSIVETGYNTALRLVSAEQSGGLVDNRVQGDIVLQNSAGRKAINIDSNTFEAISVDGNLVMPRGHLRLAGNLCHRALAMIESRLISSGVLQQPVTGYQSLAVTDNTFIGKEHSFIAAQLSLQGNQFPGCTENNRVGVCLADRGVYVGNAAVESSSVLRCGAPSKSDLLFSANLLTASSIPVS